MVQQARNIAALVCSVIVLQEGIHTPSAPFTASLFQHLELRRLVLPRDAAAWSWLFYCALPVGVVPSA
jgi:hypothetical protein